MPVAPIRGPVLIAGGSSGMGKALAARLLAEDVPVVIAGRSEERLAFAMRELGGGVTTLS